MGVTAWETYLHWQMLACDEVSWPLWTKLWLAASNDSFQTTGLFTLIWLPFGLAIQKEVVMRFLNREATIEKAKESGHAEGRVEGRAERDKEWDAYTERMKAALVRGETFDEPSRTAPLKPAF